MNHGVLRWEWSLTIYNVYIFTYHIQFPHLIENTLVWLFKDFPSDVVYFLYVIFFKIILYLMIIWTIFTSQPHYHTNPRYPLRLGPPPQTFQHQPRHGGHRYEIGGFDHLQNIQSLQVLRAEFYVKGWREFCRGKEISFLHVQKYHQKGTILYT